MAPSAIPSVWVDERGWELSKQREETVFEGLGVSVEGRTDIYEDRALRERIAEAGGPDRVWRFFFVSALDIAPSPGFGMASLARPHVVRESRNSFAEELRDRGFEDIDHGRTESLRTDGTRLRLTPHTARLEAGGHEVDIGGAVAVWYDGGFYVAGGAYPESGLDAWVEADEDYEAELLELIRAVV